VDNATLVRRFGLPQAWEQWIDTFVGTKTRHFAVDLESGEVRYSLADMAETAASRALTAAGLRPADIDLLVMGTATPDMLMPATVNLVGDRLGIGRAATYQLQSGCTGALQALSVAYHMLRSGQHHSALVMGGDTCAKHLDLTVDVGAKSPQEQVNGVLFGDGAGAAVLSSEPRSGSAAVRHVFLEFAGLNRPPGQIVEWFGAADRGSGRPPVTEDYKAIEESVPKLATETLQDLLEFLQWSEDDIDYLLPPQLSGTMSGKISRQLPATGATEVSCVADTGNTGNALPFFQLEHVLPRMAAAERAVGIAIESSKWIKGGFAMEKL
jgi:3-oxoacyl-[acyl-carrier-protein] synthase-3